MIPRITRPLAALAAAVVVGFTIPAPAQALTSPAASAADWLSKQLTDGLAHNAQHGFDDYGLTLDIFFALDALDTKTSSARSIIAELEKDPTQYTTDPWTADSHFAGNLGKLATAVQLSGKNASAFGGHDLIAETEQQILTSGAENGRGKDTYVADFEKPFGEPETYDYSNTFGQSWIVRALTTADSPRAGDVTAYLLKQQCNDGSFREELSGTACTTGTGSIDATAFAVQALTVAGDQGISGLDDDIADAIAWLGTKQARSGAFSDAGSFNTNSTGLVASVLAAHGKKAAAQKAAAWVLEHQVTAKVAGDGPLKSEVGAVAYDGDILDAATKTGITVEAQDQWRRATAQAAIGLDIELPAETKPPKESKPPKDSKPPKGDAPTGGQLGRDLVPPPAGVPAALTPGAEPETQEPEEPADTESESEARPEPLAGDETSHTDALDAAPRSAESDGISTGWIVAAVAGALMVGTAAGAAMTRVRGGGTP